MNTLFRSLKFFIPIFTAAAIFTAGNVKADEVPLAPEAKGIWVREIPEGKTTMYASLYVGDDNNYSVSYSGGKKPKAGELGKIKVRDGKWYLDEQGKKALRGPLSREGDKLLLLDDGRKLYWKHAPGQEEPLLFAKSAEPKATDDKVFAWLQDGPTKNRTVLVPESRQMLATADGLTQLFNKIEEPQKPEMTISSEADGSQKITMRNGTMIRMYSDGRTTMDSGDPDADGIFNSSMAGDYDSAIDSAKRLLARDPNNTSTFVNLAEIAFQKGDFDDEIFFAEHAITLSLLGYHTPADERGLQSSEIASLFDKKAHESINSILASAFRHRGIGQLGVGNAQQAIADLTQSTAYGKNSPADVFLYRAEARASLGQNAEALADLNESITKDEKNEIAYCFRGLVKKRLGLTSQAATDTERANELKPSFAARCAEIQS